MKILALSFLLFATSPIVVDSTKLAPGQSVLEMAGSRKVHVSREGATVTVIVEEGKRVDTITMTHTDDGQLQFGRSDNGEKRQLIALDRRPVIVDGIDLEPFLAGNFLGTQRKDTLPAPQPQPDSQRDASPRYYMCPKDATMVRVPSGPVPPEMKCPVDGTPMVSGTGQGSQYFLLH